MEIEETALSPDARYRCGIDPGDGFAGRGWSRVWGSDFPQADREYSRFFLQQCSILVRVGFPTSSDINAGPGRTDCWSPGLLFCPGSQRTRGAGSDGSPRTPGRCHPSPCGPGQGSCLLGLYWNRGIGGPRRTHRSNRFRDRFGGWSSPQTTERTDPNPGGLWCRRWSCRHLQCSDCRCDICP